MLLQTWRLTPTAVARIATPKAISALVGKIPGNSAAKKHPKQSVMIAYAVL
jgi:hypothetical protein